MLWTLFVVTLVLWLAGVVSGFVMAGVIHVLLILAMIALISELLTGDGVLVRRLAHGFHSVKGRLHERRSD